MTKLTAQASRMAVALCACIAMLATFGIASAGAAPTTTTTPSGTQTPAWSFVPLSASANHLTRSAIHLLASPGQTVTDTAVLTNYSSQELDFNVYGSDAYNTLRLGAFTLNPPNAPKTDVGKWITLPVNIYNLPPKTSATFHFTVTVPSNASPGDHAGGVVALNTVNPGVLSGTKVAVQRGEGIAVYVRVPGALHPGVAAANIGAVTSTPPIGFGSSWAQAHYQVDNTGNVVLNGKAQLEATDVFGNVVKKFNPVPIDALIPGQKMVVVEPRWNDLPFAGPVHLKLIMTTSSVKSTGVAVIWVVPWLLILIIVLLIILLVLLWIRRRRRRAAALPPPTGGGVDAPVSPPATAEPGSGEPAKVG